MSRPPGITLEAMRRAKTTLEDFVSSYFMFHGLDASQPAQLFEHLPLLMFVEAFIYQLDQDNEDRLAGSELGNGVRAWQSCNKEARSAGVEVENHAVAGSEAGRNEAERSIGASFEQPDGELAGNEGQLQAGAKAAKRRRLDCSFPASEHCARSESFKASAAQQTPPLPVHNWEHDGPAVMACGGPEERSMADGAKSRNEDLSSTQFAGLADLLDREELLTSKIREELHDGLEFWRLERKLCWALSAGKVLERSEVVRAVALKSFDYRVLNLLLYLLRGQAVNEQHFEFLKASELLVEISDDLFDYEDDVLNNTFNVYRMFLAMYGPAQGQLELAHWISDIERRYERLLSGLEPSLAAKYRERCRSAAKEGGAVADSSSPMGSWTLPPPIIDEGAYREAMRKREPDAG